MADSILDGGTPDLIPPDSEITVTGLTAARMLQIEAESVVDGDVVAGRLILTTYGGQSIDAGSVIGPAGPTGASGTGTTPGPTGPTGPTGPIGPAGPAGADGINAKDTQAGYSTPTTNSGGAASVPYGHTFSVIPIVVVTGTDVRATQFVVTTISLTGFGVTCFDRLGNPLPSQVTRMNWVATAA